MSNIKPDICKNQALAYFAGFLKAYCLNGGDDVIDVGNIYEENHSASADIEKQKGNRSNLNITFNPEKSFSTAMNDLHTSTLYLNWIK